MTRAATLATIASMNSRPAPEDGATSRMDSAVQPRGSDLKSAAHVTTAAPSRHDHRLRDYLLGTFAFTWALWVPAGLDLRGALNLPVPPTMLTIIGAFGPMVAALTVAGRHGGWNEVWALLARLRFRVTASRWCLLAFVLGAVTLVPALVFLASGNSTDAGKVGSHLVILPIHFVIVATIGGGLDEELGWRGMAQPLLQRRLSPLPANLVLGIIWAIWHLPLWLDPASAQSAYPFAVYTAVIVGHSLVTGYLYNASGGSLLVAVTAHSTNNTFDGLRYAVLGDSGRQLLWQVVLAAVAMGLGIAITLKTGGRLGIRADHSSDQ